MYVNGVAAEIYFQLTNKADGTPCTGASPSVSVSKDGGAQSGGAGGVSELGGGQYVYAATSGEMTPTNVVAFLFSATGAISVTITIPTFPANIPANAVEWAGTPILAASLPVGQTAGVNNGVLICGANGTISFSQLTVSNTVTFAGAVELSGVLTIAGVATLATITFSNPVTLAQTLTFTDQVTYSATEAHAAPVTLSTLTVSGPTTVSTLTLSNPVTMSQTLTCSDPVVLNTVTVSGPVNFSTITFSDPVTFSETVTFSDPINLAGTLTISGPVLMNTLTVSGPATFATQTYSDPVTYSETVSYSDGVSFNTATFNAATIAAIQNGLAISSATATPTEVASVSATIASGFLTVATSTETASVSAAIASGFSAGATSTQAVAISAAIASGFAGAATGTEVAAVSATLASGVLVGTLPATAPSTFLDSISIGMPSGEKSTWNFRQRMMAIFARWFNKVTQPDDISDGGTQTVYADDNTTPIATQTVTDDGTNQTQGGV